MQQIVVAVGVNSQGNLSNLYTGFDPLAALSAIQSAGAGGTINIGYVYQDPVPAYTMRYIQAAAPTPTIASLTPNTAVANANVTVTIAGTNFDPASVRVLVGAVQLTPQATPTATSLTVVITAAAIPSAGTYQVRVKNGDNQQSGTLNFTAT